MVDGPTPAVADSLTWTPGATPKRTKTLTLSLSDVAALTVDTKAAQLKCATVTATSDGPATLTLLGLRAGATVTENGGTVASGAGSTTIPIVTGKSVFSYC